LNLLSNKSTTIGTGSVNVLSSLDRSGSGVAASSIAVGKKDLGLTAASFTGTALTAGTASTLNATQTQTIAITAPTAIGTAYSIGLAATDADSSKFVAANYTTGATTLAQNNILYVSREGDTAADVAKGLAAAFAGYMSKQGLDTDVVNVKATGGSLNFTSAKTDATDTVAVRVDFQAVATSTIGGGLANLSNFDVTSTYGAKAALSAIEGAIQLSVDSAAAFGSVQGRIENQAMFISKMADGLKSGIGTLVDANMEEASARLQALQVQQQLGVQSLSIANQAPQSILSLFR
jgi:flagellin